MNDRNKVEFWLRLLDGGFEDWMWEDELGWIIGVRWEVDGELWGFLRFCGRGSDVDTLDCCEYWAEYEDPNEFHFEFFHGTPALADLMRKHGIITAHEHVRLYELLAERGVI